MLTLKKHHAEMGIINNRIEKHGNDNVTAFDIPIVLLLDPDQLEQLLGKGQHDHMFEKQGRSFKPRIPDVESMLIRHDLDGANVVLHLDKSDIEFEEARLKGLTLQPLAGGETQLHFKLQVRPENKHILRLLDTQNCELKLSLADAKIAQKAKSKQEELPLGAPAKPGNGQAHAEA